MKKFLSTISLLASKKKLEIEYEAYKLSMNDLKDKYIALLEEKSKAFDKYLYFEELSNKLAEEKKELKKEVAQLKENLTNKK